MSARKTLTLAALLLALSPLSGLAETLSPEASIAKAWEETSLSLFKDANQRFAKVDGREARFGEAVTLLQVQPKTDSNIERSATLLNDVIAKEAGDKIGIAARYYLGRLEQVHRTPTNAKAAAEHYNILIKDFPGHPLTEQAITKLALIKLYDEQDPAVIRSSFDRFTKLAKTLTTNDAIRDLNLTLAESALRYHFGEGVALEHYINADKAGINLTSVRSSVLISIGELARKTGHIELARTYYQTFLDVFQRDTRRRMISERLSALPAPSSKHRS